MKKIAALVLAIVLVIGLVACGSKKPAETTAAGGEKTEVKTYKFGVIYTANNYFWDKVGDGAKAKAEELNATGKYNISIYAYGPQTTGAAGQIQLLEDMISQKYSGVIISASDTTALAPTVDKAVDAGIPVICMDTEMPESKRLCFVGTDNYNFGRDCARELARVLNGKGNVLVQYLDPAMLSMAERSRGFRETIEKEFPDMKILFEQADTGGDMTAIAANLETMVIKYKDEFDGYCMLYAGGEQAINVWKAQGWTCEDKAMVLSDDLDAIILGIKDGTCNSSVVQNQFNWGYEGVRILVEYLAEGITPPEFVETVCYACTKDLAEQNYPNVKPAN